MIFIFPQNYNFKNKLFGIVNYSTAIINLIIISLLFFISNLLFTNILFRIVFIFSFYLPFFLFSFSNLGNENLLYIFFYLFDFSRKRTIYLYKKDSVLH